MKSSSKRCPWLRQVFKNIFNQFNNSTSVHALVSLYMVLETVRRPFTDHKVFVRRFQEQYRVIARTFKLWVLDFKFCQRITNYQQFPYLYQGRRRGLKLTVHNGFKPEQWVQISRFLPKSDFTCAISQKSTVHLHPLHPPYAAPGLL